MNQQAFPTMIIGASEKPERYSYQAILMLKQYKYPLVAVHPRVKEVAGISVLPTIEEAQAFLGALHTMTLYVGESISNTLVESIIAAQPQRVIFNPGAENPQLMKTLEENGIRPVEACTLVLLRTQQYEIA